MKQIVPSQMDRPYSLVAAVLLTVALAMAPGQVMATLEQARTQGIAWLIEEQNGDGSWGADGARVAATAEVLSALRGSGVNHGVVYSRGLAWLANVRTDRVDSLARKIIALELAGIDTRQLGLVDELIARRNPSKAWGAFAGYQHGLPDSALAMQAIRVSGASYADTSASLGRLLDAQQAGDSGWPYMGGTHGQGNEGVRLCIFACWNSISATSNSRTQMRIWSADQASMTDMSSAYGAVSKTGCSPCGGVTKSKMVKTTAARIVKMHGQVLK